MDLTPASRLANSKKLCDASVLTVLSVVKKEMNHRAHPNPQRFHRETER